MAEEESKNLETVPDSTENGMMATKNVGDKQSTETREATDDSKEAVEGNKKEIINESRKSTENKSPKKCDQVEDTVQSSSLQSSTGDEMPVTETTAKQSPDDETKTTVTSSEEKPVEEKKSPVKTGEDKASSSVTSQPAVEENKQSPKKSPSKVDGLSSVEKISSEKSPSKAVEKKSPSKVAEKKSPEQTPMEADSSEADTMGSPSKTTDVSDDDKVKEHLKLLGEGKKAFANNDFLSAADYFGRAAELSRTVYGEFSEKNGETLYLYGATMLECWKHDNSVLGENMKGKDEDEGYDDGEDDDDDDEEEAGEEDQDENAEAVEKMETEESEASESKINGDVPQDDKEKAEAQVQNGDVNEHDKKLNGDAEEPDITEQQNGEEPSSSNAEEKTDDKEDEDNYLKVAWEMLDLAKIIYHKVDDKKRLADTYMKLGEVAVESGHETATEEMKKCLDLRQLFLEPHDRVIAETHFNIGVAFSVFKLFDEATKHFEMAKEILQNKMKVLKDLNTEESLKEFDEIESIIPELKEKIQDMADSKRDEATKAAGEDSNGCSSSAAPSSTDSKPASNISHLVKRKRKMEDIIAEKSTKMCRVEVDETKTSSENSGPKD